jgi:shikimate dehydrogenase
MKLFGIIGKPVSHSLSPMIHNRWFSQLNLNYRYLKIHSLNTKHALDFSKKLNISGLNVTAPYKEQLLNLTVPDEASQKIGAINTILFQEHNLSAFNTDFIGVAEAIKKFTKTNDSSNLNAVILGSGGAAKAATYALTNLLKIKTTIIARNKIEQSKFEILGATFCELSSDNAKVYFNNADIVITTLPPNVELPCDFIFKKTAILFDAIYNKSSLIYKNAKSNNIRTIDGIEWLFEQAKPAFKIFTNTDCPNDDISFLLNASKKTKPIILIGMMGSGKSSVARQLGLNNLSVIDLDQQVEKETNLSIAQIFNSFGEAHFRELELNALKQALESDHDVIACGGGIVTSNQAINILQNQLTIWLWASPAELCKRLANNLEERPLLSSSSLNKLELSDKISHLYESRFDSYATCASIVFDAESLTAQQLATEIINEANII